MDYWVHDLSPFMIQVGDGWGIRWYGFAYIAGLVIGWWMVKRWATQGRIPMQPIRASDFATYIGIGMVVGGRLGYVLLYAPHLLIDFGGGLPFWGLLKVNEGGMASHGGIVGFFAAIWFFCRKYKVPFLVMTDVAGALIPIGIFCGRMANFINGELWGRVTDVSWGVHFPGSIIENQEQGRLTEGLAQFKERVPEMAELSQAEIQQAIQQAPYSPAWYAFQECLTLPRHPSQLYAAALEGVLVFAITLWAHHTYRRPGLTSGVVLTCYSIVRIIGEHWRQWDKGHDPLIGEFLTKGQMYSVPVLAVGLFLMWWAITHPPRPELYVGVPDDESADGTASSATGKP